MKKTNCYSVYKRCVKRKVSLVLAFLLAVSCFVPVVSFAQGAALTRAETAQMICAAAQSYHPGLTEGDIIKGYGDGAMSWEKPVTRVEAYSLLARAFGPLKKPEGNNLRSGVFGLTLEDVPQWAQKDIKELTDAGLITWMAEKQLGAQNSVSAGELQVMLHRLYAYIGTNAKDDFASTVNRKWLADSEIPQGYSGITTFQELELQNDENVKKIIDESIEKNEKKGSDSYKVSAFYESAMDTKTRDRQGIVPVQKYLTLIGQAENMEQLFMADAELDRETGTSCLLAWNAEPDARDNTKNLLTYYGVSLTMDKNSFESASPELVQAMKDMVEDYLILSGMAEKKAKTLAEKVYELEKSMSEADLDAQEASDINRTYNVYSVKKFDSLFTNVNMEKVLKAFELNHVTKLNVVKEELTKKVAQLMAERNLETWKAWMTYHLLYSNRVFLSHEADQIGLDFTQVMDGSNGELTDEEKALQLTKSYVNTPIEKAYIKQHFSKSAKKDIEHMAAEFIGVYKERLLKNQWLSEETRKMAVKKLDAITVKVGYPGKWPDDIKRAEILAPDDGGVLFRNAAAVKSVLNEKAKDSLGKEVDKEAWGMTAYEVNAYYNPSANEIVFPAGILQAPFYDVKAQKEKNLGGIGAVVAHEITHAFDNNGAAYDEKGNAKNWWTEKDFANFQTKCEQAASLYDKVEVAPGIQNNGAFTVSENVADLGGLSCALEAAGKLNNPDYKALFENFATVFRVSRPREALKYYSNMDVHSNGRIRVNRAVINFGEFYQTYGVMEGDGMYLPPEQRVTIW